MFSLEETASTILCETTHQQELYIAALLPGKLEKDRSTAQHGERGMGQPDIVDGVPLPGTGGCL